MNGFLDRNGLQLANQIEIQYLPSEKWLTSWQISNNNNIICTVHTLLHIYTQFEVCKVVAHSRISLGDLHLSLKLGVDIKKRQTDYKGYKKSDNIGVCCAYYASGPSARVLMTRQYGWVVSP